MHWLFQTMCLLLIILSSLAHPYSKQMASSPVFLKSGKFHLHNLPQPFCLTSKLLCTFLSSQVTGVLLFLPREPLLCSCFHFLRASLKSPLFPGISKFSILAASYLEIYSGFSPAQKHSLCYTDIISLVKQRSFTANPFERVAHTRCFLFFNIHSCKSLQPGLCPHHLRILRAPRSLVSEAINPQHSLLLFFWTSPYTWQCDLPLIISVIFLHSCFPFHSFYHHYPVTVIIITFYLKSCLCV